MCRPGLNDVIGKTGSSDERAAVERPPIVVALNELIRHARGIRSEQLRESMDVIKIGPWTVI